MKKLKRAIFTFILTFVVTFLISLRIYGEELPNLFNKGVIEYKTGNYVECINIMDRIIASTPQNYYALYYKSIALVKLKKYEEAKNYYYEIITNSSDTQLADFAKNGIRLLDPNSYKQGDSIDNSSSNVIIKEITDNHQDNKTLNKTNKTYSDSLNQVAKENNVSSKELNDLIAILSKNPSVLNTINKLANNNNNTNNASTNNPNTNSFDPKSVAQLVKMLTLNSEMSLLNSNNDSNNSNNTMLDMIGSMSGSNNKQQNLIQYLNQNKGKINPDLVNTLMNQNMLSF